jgi:hypothetical protein
MFSKTVIDKSMINAACESGGIDGRIRGYEKDKYS